MDLVKYFVSLGWDIHEKDHQNLTAFELACEIGKITWIQYFISLGCKFDEQNKWGGTPFLRVCNSGNLEAIQYFISLGCEINHKDNFGRSACDIVIMYKNDVSILLLLLEYGCEIHEMFQDRVNSNLKEAIETQIQKIETLKQVLENLWIDIDMYIIDTIFKFTFGLDNLKKKL